MPRPPVRPLLVGLALLAPGAPAAAQSTCVKQVAAAPAIDGVVAAAVPSVGCVPDAVWAGVAPLAFQPDASSPFASLYLAQRPAVNQLYLGVAVGGDEDLSDQDYVLFYFDADGSGAYNAGDFAVRVRVSANATPITAGRQCNVAVGAVEVYPHNGAGFVLDPALGAQVTARVAYDYETAADPDGKLWNLELAMPTNGSFTLGAAYALGGFVYVDDGQQQAPQIGTVLKWPGALAATPAINVTDPAFAQPPAAQLADAAPSDACFDVNFTAANPWRINGAVAASNDHRIQPGVNNTFQVTFYYDGPGADPLAAPNGGTVRLGLDPYGTLGAGSAYRWTKELPVTVNTANSTGSATFTYNFGALPANWGGLGTINFVCAKMDLVGFQRDDVTLLSSNHHEVNYNRFQTSEYTQTILLSADGEGIREGEETTILVHAVTTGEAAGAAGTGRDGGSGPLFRLPTGSGWAWLVVAALAGAALLAALRAGRLRKGPALGGLALVVLVALAACRPRSGPEPSPQPSEERWTFANAGEIGLRPLRGEPGWYTLPMRGGEVRPLEVVFAGRPMPRPVREVALDLVPGQEGMPRVDLDVEPGRTLTLVANGTLDLDGPEGPLQASGANGFPDGQRRRGYVLNGRYDRPADYAGALIGSFDGFETSFVVGSDVALIVPSEASRLSLTINSPRELVGRAVGRLDLSLTDAPPLQVPTAVRVSGDGTFQQPLTFPIWEALPALHVYTYRPTRVLGDDGAVLSETRHPVGFSHAAVYNSHIGR